MKPAWHCMTAQSGKRTYTIRKEEMQTIRTMATSTRKILVTELVITRELTTLAPLLILLAEILSKEEILIESLKALDPELHLQAALVGGVTSYVISATNQDISKDHVNCIMK